MRTSIATQRLLLRELRPSDDIGMFELDSDPAVHTYLGRKPVTDIEQSRAIIAMIRQQYMTNGIGRWAVINKETSEFMGWAGLKVEANVNGYEKYYDLGYRLIPKYWGRGYATEACRAFINIAFKDMKLQKINAYVEVNNAASNNVLIKSGFMYVNSFDCDGEAHNWYELQSRNEPV